jgi:hypothetical protein
MNRAAKAARLGSSHTEHGATGAAAVGWRDSPLESPKRRHWSSSGRLVRPPSRSTVLRRVWPRIRSGRRPRLASASADQASSGDFDVGESLGRLAQGPGEHVFAVKLTYWWHP